MNTYQHQVSCPPREIDRGFWKAPEGVSVPDDELRFLLIPDAVEAMAAFELSQQVHRYQQEQLTSRESPITRALSVTMGGVLPGIFLFDHLVEGRPPGTPEMGYNHFVDFAIQKAILNRRGARACRKKCCVTLLLRLS